MTQQQIIKVQYPVLDHSQSVANCGIVLENIQNGTVTIEEAFSGKNNPLFIFIESPLGGFVTVKAGSAYPNSMLGDLKIELSHGLNSFQLQDLSRFEKADGSIDLYFDKDFVGKIFAVSRWQRI